MKEKYELKHHKDFHKIQFQDFNVKDRSLIFALCYKLMEQNEDIIKLSVKEISKISNYKPVKAGDNIYKSLAEAYNRIKNASICIKKDTGIKHFVLFTTFETFEDQGIVEIEVNKNYRYLLNKVTAPFTIQNLLEYTKLNSGYSQLTYSILREWDKSKKIKMEVEEFREKIGVPKSYDTSNFNRQVLKPIMDELPKYFSGLKLNKIKTGRKVSHLEFVWGEEKIILKEAEKLEIEISERLNKSIEKAKKNKFLPELLTEKNIYKLLNMYEEKSLIKGLNYIYKEIKKEISNFNYLVKIIETGIKETEIQIKVKVEKIEKIKEIEKKDIKIEKISEGSPIYEMFENMPLDIQNSILEKAKYFYLKELKMEKLNKDYEKFFEASKKSLIIKILKGEI